LFTHLQTNLTVKAEVSSARLHAGVRAAQD